MSLDNLSRTIDSIEPISFTQPILLEANLKLIVNVRIHPIIT